MTFNKPARLKMMVDRKVTPQIPITDKKAMELLIDVLLLNIFEPQFISTGRDTYFVYLCEGLARRKYAFWGKCERVGLIQELTASFQNRKPDITREKLTLLIRNSTNLRKFDYDETNAEDEA